MISSVLEPKGKIFMGMCRLLLTFSHIPFRRASISDENNQHSAVIFFPEHCKYRQNH